MDEYESQRRAISRIVNSLWTETGRKTELAEKQENKKGRFLKESFEEIRRENEEEIKQIGEKRKEVISYSEPNTSQPLSQVLSFYLIHFSNTECDQYHFIDESLRLREIK